ncbi:MAG: rod shape-determining protein MreD [Clostridia bacterium]|nr:rod shape-determining protein MreD [Clostridia bacterium]
MENGSIQAEKKFIRNRRIILTAAVLVFFLLWNNEAVFPKPWGIPAMLMVPVVISIGMFERETAGMFFGLFAGVLTDAFSSQTVCFHSVMLTAAGYFSGVLITRLMRNNLKTCLLLNVIFLFVYNTLFYLINYRSADAEYIPYAYSDVYVASVFYTMLFVPFVYWIIRAIFKKSTESR